MSGNNVNFNFATTNNANDANDGAPQVSILAAANTRANLQKKRCQSHFGKKYPGVGTHRRNTKHVWLFSELAELSGAYKEHHTMMPCWRIAEMLHYSFSQQIQYNQTKNAQQQEQEQEQEEAIAQQQEPRKHLPTIQAIQSKLLDCIMLQHSETTFGYAAQPSQMHRQVWEHLELAEKHRTMLKNMAAAAAAATTTTPVQQIKQEQQEEQQQEDSNHGPLLAAPVWNVHPRSFYTPDAEFEAAQPPTKRRKVVSDDDDAPASKAEFDAGIKEIMSLLEDTEEVRRQERTLIQQLVAQILEHNDQLGSLVSNIKDSHAEIEQHRQAIAHKMQQIESVIAAPAAPAAPAASAPPATLATLATPSTPTPICTKCTKRIEGDLGGFSVYRAAAEDSTQSQGTTTYECDNCAPISPATRQYFEQMQQAETEAEEEMSDDGEYAIDFEGDRMMGSDEGEEESRHASFWRFYYDGQEETMEEGI
jgi:hypothetical protein